MRNTWLNQLSSRPGQVKAVLGAVALTSLSGCFGGNVAPAANVVPPIILASYKTYIGKTYHNPGAIGEFCQNPGFPINQADACFSAVENNNLTVLDAVQSDGDVYIKLKLSDGREGFIEDRSFRIIDQYSRPVPKIGMTEDQALGTNWGFPATKNVTAIAGHRSEQWVFPDLGYLYIEDGRLTTVQRIGN